MVPVSVFWFALLIGVLALRIFGGRPGGVTLLEYQRGVLYRRGLPVSDLGTGRHLVFTGIDKVVSLDTRPIQFSYEDQAVALRDGSTAVYSISGAARVQDTRKALYSAGNFSHVPSFVMLCCARVVLNGCKSTQLKAGKDAVADQITARAKPRLEAAGFELLSFRLTECNVAQPSLD